MVNIPASGVINDESTDVPVEPYARVVPAGTRGNRMRATLLFTPDRNDGNAKDTGFSLSTWTNDIFSALRGGIGAEGFEVRPWSLPLAVLPITYEVDETKECPKPTPASCGEPQIVRGKARLVEKAFRSSPGGIAKVGGLWANGFFETPSQDNWMELSKRIEQSLLQGAMETEFKETMASEDLFGPDGQVDKKVEAEGKHKLTGMIAVPQADLSVCLEFQRVEELLCSITCACDDADAKRKAELDRLVNTITSLEEDRKVDKDDERARRTEQPGPYLSADIPTDEAELTDKLADIEGTLETQTINEKKETKLKEHSRLRRSAKVLRDKAKDFFDKAQAEQTTTTCGPIDCTEGLADAMVFATGVEGEEAFSKAADMHDLASWATYKKTGEGEPKERVQKPNEDTADLDIAAQTFFTAQSTPAIARLFGLAVDVEIERSELETTLATCLAGKQEGFLYISCPTSTAKPLPWTLVKVRLDDNELWFWPATEAEVNLGTAATCDANNVSEYDGHLVMGAGTPSNTGTGDIVRRFEITSLDIRTATELEQQRRKTRLANLQSVWPDTGGTEEQRKAAIAQAASDAHWEDLEDASTFQTAGFSLLDRGILRQAARKAARRKLKADAGFADCGAGVLSASICNHEKHIVLDAEDLVIGTRLDVGQPTKDGTVWRSLTARVIDFGVTGSAEMGDVIDTYLPALTEAFKSSYRIGLDSALHSAPARLTPLAAPPADGTNQPVEAMLEEALVQWDGTPMGADTTPKPTDQDYVTLDAFEFGREITLPSSENGFAPELLVPELRYGLPYRFKMRAVYQGGNSVPVDSGGVSDDDLNGQLFLPAKPKVGKEFARFLRQHRIDSPVVLLDSSDAKKRLLPMGPERGTRVVVRSFNTLETPEDKTALQAFESWAKPKRARRILLPANTSLEEAERHGVLDRFGAKRPRGLFPRARMSAKGAFPVTVSTTRKGSNDNRFLTTRRVSLPPEAPDPSTDREYGDPVLEGTRSFSPGRYYPDPSAQFMAFGLRRPGSNCYLDAGDSGITIDHTKVPQRTIKRRYPDITPVVLDVVADENAEPRVDPMLQDVLTINSWPVQLDTGGRNSSNTKHASWNIIARLAPGESYILDFWSIPSPEELARSFSLVQALGIYAKVKGRENSTSLIADVITGLEAVLSPSIYKKLCDHLAKAGLVGPFAGKDNETSSFVGPGGHVAPPRPVLLAIAKVLHDLMKIRPLPEVAAVQSVEITHATNRPVRAPIMVDDAHQDPFEGFIAVEDEAEQEGEEKKKKFQSLRVLRPAFNRLQAAKGPAELNDPLGFEDETRVIAYDSSEFVLDGSVELALDTVDGFEIVATTALPSSSQFDNRSRGRTVAARREGDWPTFKRLDNLEFFQTGRDIFGFHVNEFGHIEHDRSEVVLLRVEHIGRPVKGAANGYEKIDLRQFFLSDTAPVGNWRVTQRHSFPDGKARNMQLALRAFSRTSGLMRTVRHLDGFGRARGIEELPNALSYQPSTTQVAVTLPATRRPPVCKSLGSEPEFAHETHPQKIAGQKDSTRRIVTRIRLGREWFATGEGEQLGIVLWPPEISPRLRNPFYKFRVPFKGKTGNQSRSWLDLGAFEDGDLGPGGAYITRLGTDPTISQKPTLTTGSTVDDWSEVSQLRKDLPDSVSPPPRAPGPFVAPYAFRRDLARSDDDPRKATYVERVSMPTATDAQLRDTLTPNELLDVGLICYTPRFDAEEEEWFVEVDLDTQGLPHAFLRLGIVRYQPNTRKDFRVSNPVAEEVQVLPSRALRVKNEGRDFSFNLYGVSGRGAKSLLDDSLDGEAVLDETKFTSDADKMLLAEIRERDERFGRPRVVMRVIAESKAPAGLHLRLPVVTPEISAEGENVIEELHLDPFIIGGDQHGVAPTHHGWLSRWRQKFTVPESTDPDATLVLYIEERIWRRDSSYILEPLPPTKLHGEEVDTFSPSGPSYAARVVLGKVRDL